MAELFAAYLKDREADGKLMPAFHDNWKALKPRFGNLSPDDITVELCRSYTRERIQGGCSAGTVWSELTRLRACLNWSRKRRLIVATPYVWMPMKPPPRDRVLTPEEFVRLLDGCVMPHVKLFCILVLTTSGRSTAILELKWVQIDFAAGTIDLRSREIIDPLTKRVRKGRAIVPMNRLARSALQDARQGALSEWVVEWDGEPVKSIRRGFTAAVTRAGLKDVTPHTIRHTVATWAEEAGINLDRISRFLGHKDRRTTEAIYSHPSPHALSEVSDVVEARVADARVRQKH